ncbi:MAG TPA: hypothetical protein VFU81_04840 [Thermomicrobiales bacterium]|nr:hypothetical protein [Thermomicrobiales bacterium]
MPERIEGGFVGPGEYAPAGELQGQTARFSLDQIAAAFQVDRATVERAAVGELGEHAARGVTSREAQRLSEVLLPDQPLPEREAALMTLGAFTPRRDEEWGLGDTAPGQESDRYAADPDEPPDDLASRTGSYDPSQPSAWPPVGGAGVEGRQ